MKSIFILSALLMFASCRKESTYVCTIENWTPEGITPYRKATVTFTGSPTQMKAYEVAGSWNDTVNHNRQLTICK